MQIIDRKKLRDSAVVLRLKGETYSKIQKRLGCRIAKATLSYWCSKLELNTNALNRLRLSQLEHLEGARASRAEKQKVLRRKYFEDLVKKNRPFQDYIHDPIVTKMLLVMLYLGEGGKSVTRSGPMLGNADPDVIRLYMQLMSRCYDIVPSKLRCTVQCRDDQNKKELEDYWSSITGIPQSQFYKTRVDEGSKGKITHKIEYRGVCRIDYFSKAVLDDILAGIEVIKTLGR